MKWIFALALGLVAMLAACGADGNDSASGGTAFAVGESAGQEDESHDDGGHDEEFGFGGPADSSVATRVIEVTLLDTLRFTPDSIEVEDGEVVTFVLRNEGAIEHDFTIGDIASQDAHEAEMADMSATDHGDGNAVTVQPGETLELTWRFANTDGGLFFGCHVPGHFAAGMVGEFTFA